jgi:hypothetical protein
MPHHPVLVLAMLSANFTAAGSICSSSCGLRPEVDVAAARVPSNRIWSKPVQQLYFSLLRRFTMSLHIMHRARRPGAQHHSYMVTCVLIDW